MVARSYAVAIVGATGAVGQEMLKVLEKRQFPVKNLRLLASERSAGKPLTFCGERIPVERLTATSFKGIDLALFSAGAGVSREFLRPVLDAGAVMIDNSSAFRMDSKTPLVVPEINPQDVRWHQGVIAVPNCSTIVMVVPLWPLHRRARAKRVVVSTYQAASGAGARAMAELDSQSRRVLAGEAARPEVFPHRIAFNVFSHNTAIGPDGYNVEETKMVNETRKIFHDDTIRITATCVRVPVYRAHSEAINVEFDSPLSEDEARQILSGAPGVRLVDDRGRNHFPMPIEATGQDDILVGRIRKDSSLDNALNLFVSGDQLRKGAALDAVQIAELL